jgi:FkbM family methyltransferase
VRQLINREVGRYLGGLGYVIMRKHRIHEHSLNMLEMGAALLSDRRADMVRLVQVGAFDGIYLDPARVLIERGVSAILVEPQPEAVAALRSLHAEKANVVVEQAALAAHSGIGKLYRPPTETGSPFATTSLARAKELGDCEEIEIEFITPIDLLARHGWDHVDILQIDAEGADLELLQLFFAMTICPDIINLESSNLSGKEKRELIKMLNSEYEWLEWGFDMFAVKKNLLSRHLPYS